jgi:hypothetical protein
MTKSKPQNKSKGQISKILGFGLWQSFEICLPARSRFGEGRDFEI